MSQPNQNKQPKPKPNNKPNKFLRFTSVAFQMGGTIFLGNYLGQWLDEKYDKDFWESTVTLISVFISMYLVISQVIKVSKDDD
ncbi:AtpZ/AtpI family protein [Winogradskyella sp. SYSU M77433]|uniref:AtpZ/AtpI family protein n=1 Tax=Winogradskyella sp. SYSU M77433 TaxID=3042722 RepID=UPI002480AB0C|nr:AtpZ/AtpI family protein [Winogradskyella sp. SYSU M77433]MDH7913683.1 AtpZ/AtpI family protein [Winogradskyella sp. SYSU M77433]